MAYATFTCPDCQCEQYPMLHTYKSACGGQVKSNLRCESCGMKMIEFYCDECESTPSEEDCIS
jgi:hypothetical protein